MQITMDSRRPLEASSDLLAVPLLQVEAGQRQTSRLAGLDRALGGRLAAVLESGDFRGKPGETLLLFPEDRGAKAKRILLIGLGPESKLDAERLRETAGTAVAGATARKAAAVRILVPAQRRVRPPAAAQAMAEGATLASYRFDSYRSRGDAEEDEPGRVESVVLGLERAGGLRAGRAAVTRGRILAESQNLARDLSNEPPNELPPKALAKAAQRLAKEVGLRARVFGVAELERRKMGAILAVGGGSANPPCLIVLEHNAPAARKAKARRPPTVCLVGKGITFDSGGISIKPAASMDEMKHDMSGAAAVFGALRACALLRVPLHVVGVVPAAENLPSGTSYRPGDVVRSMSDKTIEVLNTDAEGRVVLADGLHFARTEFEPEAIIDVATLTGACMVALGGWATGLFGNHEKLVEVVRRAGEVTGERAWPLPLWDGHRREIRSEVADIKNTGGRQAGASTAAAFLSHFVGETPWVHLDIAGTGWTGKTGPTQRKGATGVGVRLMLEVLRDWRSHGIG